jgi:hypothetical protein
LFEPSEIAVVVNPLIVEFTDDICADNWVGVTKDAVK